MAMKLLAPRSKLKVDTLFGAPYAVLNLSKIGLRYFRLMIKASPSSKAKLVSRFVNHPNVGWIFSAEGWFNLAIGVWVKDNAEINDINNTIREVLGKDDEIVYQSELTSLYSFGNRAANRGGEAMPILDAVFNPVELTPLKIDYIKLLTLDSSLLDTEMAAILGITSPELKGMREELETSGVIVGYQERLNYSGIYYKVFVDTLSAKAPGAVKELTERLWDDTRCIYLERANGKYNLEFEVILRNKSEIKDYLKGFSEHKIAILTENLYTNLYPLNKIANLKEIKDTIAGQTGKVIDFRNSKLWYLNYKGAGAYLSLYENKRYFELMNKDELELFAEVTDYVKREFPAKNYSLIDIGSGNGYKGRFLIEHLGEPSVKAYYPVDIQPIELATALKAHEEGSYAKSPVLLDIENLSARFPLKLHPEERQIYAFLGGTYGNFESEQINTYLKPLLSDLSSVVLVSMSIRPEEKSDADIIRSYSDKKVEAMAFGPLAQLGFVLTDFYINPENGLHIYLGIDEGRLVISLKLAKDVVVLDSPYGKGTEFKMITSWKPSLDQLTTALEKDFEILKEFVNGGMAIVSIGPK